MRIVMTQNLANRRAGEPVEIDIGSGEWLIARDYARDPDDNQHHDEHGGAPTGRAPRQRRTKTNTPPNGDAPTPPEPTE